MTIDEAIECAELMSRKMVLLTMWKQLNSVPSLRLARQFRWRRWRRSTLICLERRTNERFKHQHADGD